MEIKKIKLLSGGFKGAEVTFLRPEQKNGKNFINEVTEKRKHPIHLDMETPFKKLRFYLLDICELLRGGEDDAERQYIVAESEVVSIKIDSNSFVISGSKDVVGGKSIKLETPKMEEGDGYGNYDKVMELIESIVSETEQYLAGTKKVSDEEVAVRWITSGKDKSEEAERYDSMSAEEKRDYHTKVLEEMYGSVVMHNDDLEMETIEPVTLAIGAPEDDFEDIEIEVE